MGHRLKLTVELDTEGPVAFEGEIEEEVTRTFREEVVEGIRDHLEREWGDLMDATRVILRDQTSY